MLILLLIFFLFSFSPVLASPTITLNSISEVITAGNTFPVTFTINEASSSATYCYKFFGGVDNDVYSITSDPSLSYTSGWIHFPQVTLDPIGPNVFNGYAYIKSDISTGTLNLKAKIALTTNTSIGATSLPISIDVVAAPPTPIPTFTPTPIPTSTPIPTPTNTPTPTKIPTSTPIPTITPISTPSTALTPIIDEILNTPTLEPMILGETTTIENITKKNFLPLILIISGGILLLSPLIITKIKK